MVDSLEGNRGFLLRSEIAQVKEVSGRAVIFTEGGLPTSVALPLPQVDLVQGLLGEVDNLQLVIYQERRERGSISPKRGLVTATVGDLDEDPLEVWFNQSLRAQGGNEIEEIRYSDDDIIFKLKTGEERRGLEWIWKEFQRRPRTEGGKEQKDESDEAQRAQWFARQRRKGTSAVAREASERLEKIDELSRK